MGSTGILRAKFTDSKNEPIQATNVKVNLYSPGTYASENAPTVSGLTPQYLGEGVFQVEITAQGPGGLWIDEWNGEVLDISTTANLSFEVLEGGLIRDYPTLGPTKNNLIEVTIASGIQALDGSFMPDKYSFFFTTEYAPLYADGRKARLMAGGILGDVPDYTLYNALLEASIEADALTFSKTINNKLYVHARREYVACKASMMVAQNLLASGGVLKAKRLADFSVDYNVQVLDRLIDSLMDVCHRWLAQLETGGQARAIKDPQMVIKGELDPDRPKFGRGWAEVEIGQKPFGNTKNLPRGKRRWTKTYIDRLPTKKRTWGDNW